MVKVMINHYNTQSGNHLDHFCELIVDGVEKPPRSLELFDLVNSFNQLPDETLQNPCKLYAFLYKPFLMYYQDEVLQLIAYEGFYLPLTTTVENQSS